ncbi:hypothetical protein Goshw_015573 [Gossypium schwendimanii]|uniref:Uncharacterized protein n=1 Tax=Gossypium schwendimanii TaxID=34291 RepID=A0A7J9LFZ1_GOSSC|nr:hypothetical protein [Gossypium schwendimanii]
MQVGFLFGLLEMAPPLTLMVPSIYSLMEPFILSMILVLLSGALAPATRVFPLLP